MAKPSLLPGFVRLPGTAERVLDTLTGQELSDRQYKRLKREKSDLTPIVGNKKTLSNEALAKFNKQLNLDEFLSRPARGRTSLKKFTAKKRAFEIEKRKQKLEEKETLAKAEVNERRIFNKIERLKNKKIGKKVFRKTLLRKGTLSRTIPLGDLNNVLSIIHSARKSGVVFGYLIGITGVNTNDGRELNASLMKAQHINDDPNLEEINDDLQAFLINHSYFVFINWWIFLRFTEEYASKNEKVLRSGHSKK